MSTRAITRIALVTLAGSLLATAAASAQSIAEQVRRAPDGTVRLSFEPRDGVCGTPRGGIQIRDRADSRVIHGRWNSDDRDTCEEGPVHIALRMRGGAATDLDVRVGGRGPEADGRVTDLGTLAPQAAAAFLLELARSNDMDVAKDAIFPAVVAREVVIWPKLLELVRDEHLRSEPRKQAIFWLGQEAASAATSGLAELVGDDARDSDVRKQAVFALSQRPNGEGIPHLIRAARTSRDPAVRKAALFWLAESKDPRAVALFEEILRG